MNEKKVEFEVQKEDTLLLILSNRFSDLSNKTIKNYIKHEMVLVDNKIVTNSNSIIKEKSRITVYFSKRKVPKIDLKILYEDKDLIAIDKPSGLLSISNNKEKDLTAFRLVSDYVKENNKNAKIFVVHRLDEHTSGVLIFSKNQKLKETMQKNWNNLVKLREYYCVVKGKMPKKETIKSYLTMNHFQIVHSTNNKEIGLLAITNYECIKYKNTYSLLRVWIDTGRRNQIRVHMSEKGHPIAGDKKYGSNINPIGRLALHASRLQLIDPRNNKLLDIKSEVPCDIMSLVD